MCFSQSLRKFESWRSCLRMDNTQSVCLSHIFVSSFVPSLFCSLVIDVWIICQGYLEELDAWQRFECGCLVCSSFCLSATNILLFNIIGNWFKFLQQPQCSGSNLLWGCSVCHWILSVFTVPVSDQGILNLLIEFFWSWLLFTTEVVALSNSLAEFCFPWPRILPLV